MERDIAVALLDEVVDKRITACWLLPLNPTQFDAIWTA
jgi:hypothetical protein